MALALRRRRRAVRQREAGRPLQLHLAHAADAEPGRAPRHGRDGLAHGAGPALVRHGPGRRLLERPRQTFTLRTIDDRPGQDLVPGGVAWGPDPQGAGFAWMSLEKSLLNGDRNVRFKPLSASEPDVAVLEVTPVQAAKDAARLAAGRSTTIRVKLRSAAPARARVPLEIELAYDDEDRERVERTIERDVVLRPGVSTVQLLADDPIMVGAGRITAKVKVSPDVYDADHSNDKGEGSRAVVRAAAADRAVRAGRRERRARARLRARAGRRRRLRGARARLVAGQPALLARARRTARARSCTTPGLTDAGLMGPRGLLPAWTARSGAG